MNMSWISSAPIIIRKFLMFILIMLTKFVFQNYYFVYSSKSGTNIQIIFIYNNVKKFFKKIMFS